MMVLLTKTPITIATSISPLHFLFVVYRLEGVEQAVDLVMSL
jgi:hypothetical protein